MCCCCCCSLVNVFFAANDIKQISNFYLRNIDLYSFDFSLFVCRCMNQIIKFGYIWKTCKDRNQENYLIEWSWFWLYSSDFSVCFNAWTSSAIKANPAICGVLWIPQVGIRWTIYGWKYCSVLQLKAKNKIHKAKQTHTQKKQWKHGNRYPKRRWTFFAAPSQSHNIHKINYHASTNTLKERRRKKTVI